MSTPNQNQLMRSLFMDMCPKRVPAEGDRYRKPQFNEAICGCSCGCSCCQNRDKDSDSQYQSGTSSPVRGRSRTPKDDCTNGNGKPIDSRPVPRPVQTSHIHKAASSVDGQEGLAGYQQEKLPAVSAKHTDFRPQDAIEQWLAHHQLPDQAYCFPASPEASMLVEATNVAPSLTSSGVLPPLAASSSDLVRFSGTGFEDVRGPMQTPTCAFTPLWLNHELRYCRNLRFGDVMGPAAGYPATLEMEDDEMIDV